MTDITARGELVCKRCNVPLKASVADPKPDDILACPKCGGGVRLQDAIKQAGEDYVRSLSDQLKEVAKKARFTVR